MGNKFVIGRNDLILIYANGNSATAADPTLQTNGFVPIKTSFVEKYTWTGGALNGLMLGAALMTQSDERSGNYVIKIPTIVNLFARYQCNRHWSTQVNVDNLTNKRYMIGIVTSGLAECDDPLQVLLSPKYK
jgi:outer membrane receptor for ferric coprogen and ferric-rhodotorulic acid